jgi:hypothetical protein
MVSINKLKLSKLEETKFTVDYYIDPQEYPVRTSYTTFYNVVDSQGVTVEQGDHGGPQIGARTGPRHITRKFIGLKRCSNYTFNVFVLENKTNRVLVPKQTLSFRTHGCEGGKIVDGVSGVIGPVTPSPGQTQPAPEQSMTAQTENPSLNTPLQDLTAPLIPTKPILPISSGEIVTNPVQPVATKEEPTPIPKSTEQISIASIPQGAIWIAIALAIAGLAYGAYNVVKTRVKNKPREK